MEEEVAEDPKSWGEDDEFGEPTDDDLEEAVGWAEVGDLPGADPWDEPESDALEVDPVVVGLDELAADEGIHLQGEDDEDLDEDDEDSAPGLLDEFLEAPEVEVADLDAYIDAFNEAFNARDLDSLLDLLATDVEAPGLGNDLNNAPESIEELWDRRPGAVLTRGDLNGRPVGVMWEIGEEGNWWRVAPLHFDDIADGKIGMLEFVEDAESLDEIEADEPEHELEEGSRWSEWAEGADG